MKKQKTLRTLLAILLLVVMLVINVPVFADATTGSITLEKVEEAAKITVYKLADFNRDEKGQPTYPTYKWVSEVDTWLKSHETYSAYANQIVDGEDQGASNFANVTEDVYNAVYGAITATIRTTGSDLSLGAHAGVSETKEGETRTLTGLTAGTYLIVIEGGNRVYQPIVRNLGVKSENGSWVVDNDTKDVTTDTKSAPVTITKTADKTQAKTTEEIPYTITADVPKYPAGALNKTFVISDNLDDVLELKADSIEVYGKPYEGDGVLLTSGYTNKEKTGYDFSLDFTYDSIAQYEQVVVKYVAKLKPEETTKINTEYKNEAVLEYANKPYAESDYTTEEKPTNPPKVKTYGFELTKVDSKNNRLTGAEFSVKDNEGNVLKFTRVADGVYYYDENGTVTTTLTVCSTGDNQGVLKVYGLTTGTYKYEETKAPENFNKLPNEVSITVGAGDAATANVVNKSGFQLPITGGMGTVIFTVAGIAFIVVGAAIVIGKKRSSKN